MCKPLIKMMIIYTLVLACSINILIIYEVLINILPHSGLSHAREGWLSFGHLIIVIHISWNNYKLLYISKE